MFKLSTDYVVTGDGKCSLERKVGKTGTTLGILLETSSDFLHRKPGCHVSILKFQVYSVSEKGETSASECKLLLRRWRTCVQICMYCV
jgi:hypothetical protein